MVKFRWIPIVAVLLFGPGAFAQADFTGSRPVAGQFDSYELAIIDHHQFCEEHSSDDECTSPNAASANLVLHGLWPNQQNDLRNQYQSCGVNPIPRDLNWCSPQIDVRSQMSPDLFSQLASQVPSTGACLYNHEWNVHGTCSGLSVQDYFATALEIDRRFNTLTAFNSLVQNNRGRTLARADLQNALVQDFGPNALSSAVVTCVADRSSGTAVFSQLVVALNKNDLNDFPTAASLTTLKPVASSDGSTHADTGNCPAQGILIAP